MEKGFLEEIEKILKRPQEQILHEEPMSRHTTFRVGGPAQLYLRPDMDEIGDVLALCRKHQVPVFLLGNGSNLLVGDKGIRGVVIEIGKEMSRCEVQEQTVIAQAGCMLSKAAREALFAGLEGMEFASGIPGSVGGAVVMNAGAYGGEIKDILLWAKVLTPQGEIRTLNAEELQLSYRHSCVPEENYVVLEAAFSLKPGDREEIEARMKDLNGRRREKQPLEYPSAGSTFKRPEGYFAGKLIMDSGLAGYQVGGAKVSEKHCGFVINAQNATAQDVRTLISDVQDKVYEKYQVRLEPEVRFTGEF